MFPPLVRFARDVSGAVAPLFAIGLVAFVGVGALAWDISRGYALRAELEAAVDAAALAGATQLDGNTGAIERANAAALGALVQNSSILADTYQANTVQAGDSIQYLTDLTTRAVTTNDAEANFIEITLAPRPMGLVLGGLLGVTSFNARAHAVAGYGSALCKVPPLFVCNPDETNTIAIYAAHAGKGIVLNGKGGGQAFAPGNFGYLQVAGNLSALQQAMGRSPPLTECYGQNVETRTGDPTSVLDWFNTRFDIFASNQVAAEKASPYYAPAEITITGLSNNSTNPHQQCKPITVGDPYDGDLTGVTAMALPRDKCAYPGYVGTACTGGAMALGDGDWNREHYFQINHGYTGAISNVSAPITGDLWADLYDYPEANPKPTYPTRYQVYLWEKLNKANPGLFGANFANANTKTTQQGDWPTRQCSTAEPVAGVPDRRTISAVVLNCSAIQNNRPQDVVGAVDLFLTEPAATNGNGTIYGEVITATSDTSAVGEETKFYSVRLYE